MIIDLIRLEVAKKKEEEEENEKLLNERIMNERKLKLFENVKDEVRDILMHNAVYGKVDYNKYSYGEIAEVCNKVGCTAFLFKDEVYIYVDKEITRNDLIELYQSLYCERFNSFEEDIIIGFFMTMAIIMFATLINVNAIRELASIKFSLFFIPLIIAILKPIVTVINIFLVRRKKLTTKDGLYILK